MGWAIVSESWTLVVLFEYSWLLVEEYTKVYLEVQSLHLAIFDCCALLCETLLPRVRTVAVVNR